MLTVLIKRLEKCIPIDKIENGIKNTLETWEQINNLSIIAYILELKDYIYEVDKIEYNKNKYRIIFHNMQNLQIDTYNLNDTRNLFQAIINYIKSEVK